MDAQWKQKRNHHSVYEYQWQVIKIMSQKMKTNKVVQVDKADNAKTTDAVIPFQLRDEL